MVTMQESKRFALDISMTFVASLISMVLVYMVTVLLGRYLGPSSLGLYRMNSTFYSFAMIIGMMGIPAAMIKYVAESKDNKKTLYEIISSGVITSLVLGTGFVIMFYILSGPFARIFRMPELSSLLKILSLVFPFTFVGGVLLGLLNGLREMKQYNIALVLQSALLVIITVPLVYRGFGVTGAVIGIVLSTSGYFLYLIWASKDYLRLTFHGYISSTKKMLKFGSQIFATNAIDLMSYRADIILIGYFLTAADVGNYTAAVGLSQFFWLIPNAIQRITYPASSAYWAVKNHAAMQTMIDKTMKYSACIMLPIALTVEVFGEDFIIMLFGERFAQAFVPLEILLIGTVVNGALVRAIGSCMAGVGRPDINLKIVTFSAAVGIVLNIVLIPVMGIVGAALATTLTLMANSFLQLFFIIRVIKVKIDFTWFGKITVVTVLAVMASIYLPVVRTYVTGVIVLCTYVVIILFWLLTREDRAYFMGLLREVHLL
ncbi:MAG: flippase [Theionarchaea archaeon]|nr:flippase [Theionarchaea archaeon]